MKIVGHRGASYLAPDNTLESIQVALNHKVDYVEIDLQLTKDKNFLVFHDDDIKLKSGNKAKISRHTTEELQKLFKNELDREALFLDRAVEYVQKTSPSTGIVLDCKNRNWAKDLVRHFGLLEKQGIMRTTFIVISFSYIGLLRFKKHEKSVKTFYLYRHVPLVHLPLTLLGGFSGAGYYITKNRILLPLKAIKKLKMELFFYNVNDPDFAKKCQHLDIEYIETDEPDKIVPAVRHY